MRIAWVKRERSENLRQDRCCEAELARTVPLAIAGKDARKR